MSIMNLPQSQRVTGLDNSAIIAEKIGLFAEKQAERQWRVLWNANAKTIHLSTLRRGRIPGEKTGLPGLLG